MAFGFTRTLPTITGNHADFPVLLVAGSFPAASIDGSAGSFINGGGNLRAYTDSTKVTRLSVEIVSFVTGGTPDVEVWVKVPNGATGATIYLEANSSASSQPAFTAAFGRNSMWSDYIGVFHCNDFVDSSGNGDLRTNWGTTEPLVVETPIGNGLQFIRVNSTTGTHMVADIPPRASNSDITMQYALRQDREDGSSSSAIGISGGSIGGNDYSVGSIMGGAAGQTGVGFMYPWSNHKVSKEPTTPISYVGTTFRGYATWDSSFNVSVGSTWDDHRGYTGFIKDTYAIAPQDQQVRDLIGLGGRIDLSPNFYNMTIVGARFLLISRSADFLDTEIINQDAPASFGTSSEWIDNGGGSIEISPISIPSSEAFGVATISTGSVSISPSGIVSSEAFGSASITVGTVSISPTGISSSEAFGLASITTGGAGVSPLGIASGESFGAPTIATGSVNIQPEGIASAESFGLPSVITGDSIISVAGIPSSEAFGQASIESGILISVVGIESSEQFGRPSIGEIVNIGDYSTSVMCEIKTTQSFSSIIDANGQSIRGIL